MNTDETRMRNSSPSVFHPCSSVAFWFLVAEIAAVPLALAPQLQFFDTTPKLLALLPSGVTHGPASDLERLDGVKYVARKRA